MCLPWYMVLAYVLDNDGAYVHGLLKLSPPHTVCKAWDAVAASLPNLSLVACCSC